MNENTTVRLHIGRLVIDPGTPLPPGGVAGLQAALEAALAAQWSGQPAAAVSGLAGPAGAGDARSAAWVRQIANAIGATVPAPGGQLAAPGHPQSDTPQPASPGTSR